MSRRHPSHLLRLPHSRRRFLAGACTVAAVAPAFSRAGWGQSQQVNVYNWDTYIGPDTLDDFTAATGIRVRYDLYGSSDELFGKLRDGNPGYDVIYPSNDYVERMIVADMLLPLDHARLPNFDNLAPRFQDPARSGPPVQPPLFLGHHGLGYRKASPRPTAGRPLRIRRVCRPDLGAQREQPHPGAALSGLLAQHHRSGGDRRCRGC